ncbi:hypothetical protein ACH5RR_020657 [Cinchona calisaya]|uniref:Uncharacterized protein n=1 Tax=Cinchona calisaya TaxID=153742 RepID=A0ABD2ZF71_9GENT
MSKVSHCSRLLKILKKKPSNISVFTSPQVPKGKYYVFIRSKGSDPDDAAHIFKQAKRLTSSSVEYEDWGDRHCAFFLMTLIGFGTTLNFTIRGLFWFVDRYVSVDDDEGSDK